MPTFGVDVHRRFLEVSVYEGGRTSRIGRVEMADLEAFADSLGPDDHVVIESTSVSWAVVDRLGRRAGRITVSNPMKTKAIASAKVNTDKVDARVLAELGAWALSRRSGSPMRRSALCAGESPTGHAW